MVRNTMSLGIALGMLLAGVSALRAEDAPAPVCDCKPMSITVRDASGAAVKTDTIASFAFGPASLTVNVGDSVTWTNTDTASHTATSVTTGVGEFDTGQIQTGQSKTVVFSTPGTFPYMCSNHPFMTGTVIVLGASKPVLKNLSVDAVVNVPFKYTISASGSPAPTFGATLPTGFVLKKGVITGTFTAAGPVAIPLTATNSQGTDSEILIVTVAASGGGGGSSDISGSWVGTLKGKPFEQDGSKSKPDSSAITLVIQQNGQRPFRFRRASLPRPAQGNRLQPPASSETPISGCSEPPIPTPSRFRRTSTKKESR